MENLFVLAEESFVFDLKKHKGAFGSQNLMESGEIGMFNSFDQISFP